MRLSAQVDGVIDGTDTEIRYLSQNFQVIKHALYTKLV